jgi:hypothetical protein
MSFIIEPLSQEPRDYPVTVQAVSPQPYVKNAPYTFNITNFDTYTTYTLSTLGPGTITINTLGVMTYTATAEGAGGFQVNQREFPFTIIQSAFWITRIGTNPGVSVTPASVTLDPTYLSGLGEFFYSGFIGASSAFSICKLSVIPTLSQQKTLSGGSTSASTGIAFCQGDIVYVVGNSNASGNNDIIVAQYDINLNLLWQRSLGGLGAQLAYDVVANQTTQDVYVVGSTDQSGTSDFFVAKYDAAGVLQWQRVVVGVNVETSRSVAIDSAGNLLVVGTGQPSGYDEIVFFKMSAAGAIVWARRLGYGALLPCTGAGAAIDSSGNGWYVIGTQNNAAMVIAKYDTGGNLQWQRLIDSPGFLVQATGAALFGVGFFLYVCGQSNVYGVEDALVLKLDNNTGAITWQRSLRNATNNTSAKSITVGGGVTDSFFVLAALTNSPTSPDTIIGKFPTDGSATFINFNMSGLIFTYGASTLTEAAGTGVDSGLLLAATPAGATSSASGLIQGSTDLGFTAYAI